MVGVRLRTGPRRPATAVMAAYGRYLAFLAASEPSALAEHPAERLTEDRLARYLATSPKPPGRWDNICFSQSCAMPCGSCFPAVCRSISRGSLRGLRASAGRGRRRRESSPVRASSRSGQSSWKEQLASTAKITDPVGYRDGLMIALLAQRPVRLRTFSLIRVGTHLRQVGEEWRMVFEGPESKSGRAFEITVPENLVPFFEYYLREVRPKFTGADRHDGLWASTKGGPLTANAIARVITERTRQAFGQSVNPHLFRHCAATTIAILQPGRIGVARDLLGHASLATTNAYYNKARSIEASRLYAGVLTGLTPRPLRR